MGHLEFSTIGSGTFMLFTLLSIAGLILGMFGFALAIMHISGKTHRREGAALLPIALMVGIAGLVPGALSQANGEQPLQAAAKHAYGINLTADQADALLAYPKTIFNAQHVQQVQTKDGTVSLYGSATITEGNQVRKIRLYEAANGTHHLATDNTTLTELPKHA